MHKDIMVAVAALSVIFGAAGAAGGEGVRGVDVCGSRVTCHITMTSSAVIRSESSLGGYLIKRHIEREEQDSVMNPQPYEVVDQPDLFRG